MSRARAGALLAAVAGMLVYSATHLELGTDLTSFLPDGGRSELAAVSTRIADSALTRSLAFTLAAGSPSAAVEAARELEAALASHPQIAWVRASADEEDLEPIYRLYFPRRHAFLSERPAVELPERLSEPALRLRARQLRQRLASPVSPLLARIAPADPLGAFESIASRLRRSETALDTLHGGLVTRDGRFAVVLAGSRASAFDSAAQAELFDFVERSHAEIARRRGEPLLLESAGAGRFAVAAERAIRRDVYTIGACAFLGVGALFLGLVGGVRGFLLVSIPPLAGMLVATSAGLAHFGGLDGLTLVFGTSLMGIAVDYSNHLLIHHGLAPGESPSRVARRIRPSLVLGALTTVASFGGLAMTAFPAFREMSFFAGVGLLAALLVTLWVLPSLLLRSPRLPARSQRLARGLAAALGRVERCPRVLLWLPGLLTAAALPGLMRLQWEDDMSRLTRFDPELVAEERRVRARIAGPEASRFVVGLAADESAAVELADRIEERLRPAVAAGELEGTRSLRDFLWPESLQRRNEAELRRDPALYERLERAFVAEGFRPGSFEPFRRDLGAAPPEPLTLGELRASPLADWLTPFAFPLGEEQAVLTHLRGLHAPEAVASRLAGLPGVHLLDQRTFVNDVYAEFRRSTLRQMLVGAGLVLLLLALRYRSARPVLASFLPSASMAVLVLALLAWLAIPLNLLHVLALVVVTGMGVDYGVFLVDSARGGGDVGATLLSLLVSCLTTAFVFGALSLSSQPALRAIGVTAGLGIVLCFLLAPLALAATGLGRRSAAGA